MKRVRFIAVPYIFWSVIFIIIPLILIVYFSFTNASGQFTFNNFIQIWTQKENQAIFVRSFILAFIATVICLVLGYPLAYILSKEPGKRQQVMVMLLMLPMWMNFLLRTYAWVTILDNNGLINRFLGFFNIAPLHMINTQGAVVLGMVYIYIPFMILPIYTVLIKLDQRLIEAAQDLGAPPHKYFTKVIFPLSMPGVVSGITMVFMPSVSTFFISNELGGSSTLMLGDLIETHLLGNAFDLNLGAAISLVMMVIILVSMMFMGMFSDEDTEVII
jgi:spermidine/putrescine transport system permease protein